MENASDVIMASFLSMDTVIVSLYQALHSLPIVPKLDMMSTKRPISAMNVIKVTPSMETTQFALETSTNRLILPEVLIAYF